MQTIQVTGNFPDKLKFLVSEKHRYKVIKGGRGGAKSWGCATALLLLGMKKPMRFLCCREIQKSLKESVYQLLKDRIQALDLEKFYDVKNSEIRGKNGTQFGFEGLHHNITNIKSWEGADIAWVEEAQIVSKNSWEILIPTIRKEESEIWVTFNPELEEDETYQRFVVNKPKDCKLVSMNYADNPWFPEVLQKEMEALKTRDHAAYLNIWEGQTRAAVQGAIFSDELRKAAEEGRIKEVPYVSTVPVNTYWDLGKSALTSIWFCQYVGMQWRILRYYKNRIQEMSHYLKVIKDLPYVYGTHYLPHDAAHNRLGMEKSIEFQAREVLGNVRVVPRVQHKIISINAAKQIFAQCWFDKELCSEGLSHLRRYAFRTNPETGRISSEPEKDTFFRDTADAFQCFAMVSTEGETQPETRYRTRLQRIPLANADTWDAD